MLFDTGHAAEDLSSEDWLMQDIHCVPSVVKLFFREMPTPVITEKCFPLLREAALKEGGNSDSRRALDHYRKALYALPRLQYR